MACQLGKNDNQLTTETQRESGMRRQFTLSSPPGPGPSPPGPLGQSYQLSAVSCQLKTKCKTQIAIRPGDVNSICSYHEPYSLPAARSF